MKKKMKVGLVVVVAIATVMMFSSYAAAEEQLSQEELEELMFANATKVNTYKFEYAMNMTLEMSMGNETNATEPMVMAMVGNGSGVVDNINKSMWMAMSMCMNMSEIMEANTSEDTNGNVSEDSSLEMPETICMETEMYLINNTMYMKMDMGYILPNFSFWQKSEMTEADWESEEIQGPQMELLNCSNVTLLDDEEVNGVDCYVLKIVPDTEKFWEIAMNQTMGGLPGFDNPMNNSQQTETGNVTVDNGNATGISYSDFVNMSMMNISITDWIAKDTKFMMKEQMTMDMTISLENLDIPDTEGGITMTMDFEMISYDYNKPVTIVLPEEAEAAIEVPTGMLPGMPAMPGTKQIVPAIV
uniref:Uncharacterized protein n=1 Tax=Candidatus Methanophaga sp. ANME-1 ERB7 TaxID=2759913 RepID=A0A7G9Z2L4_9EURY|nr:hypothetical protein DBMFGOPN_00005 [Methanosarcinales archaeon ANME-1 ERB7]